MSLAAESASPPARLEITGARATPERATIRYRFTNNGDRNDYLFHRLWEEIGSDLVFRTSVHRVYVEVIAEGVLLSKKAVPIPPNMAVEHMNLPCMSRIAPGESLEEEVEIPLPLWPHTPYLRYTDKKLAVEPSPLDAWFEVGFLAVPPEGDRLAMAVSTTEGPALQFRAITVRSQTLVRMPLALKLPVRLPL